MEKGRHRHFIDTKDIGRTMMLDLVAEARALRDPTSGRLQKAREELASGNHGVRTIYLATDEASTRTLDGMSQGARFLGLTTHVRDNMEETTSLKKLEHFDLMVKNIADMEFAAFAFRSKHVGLADIAANVDVLPIGNLGNAGHDHPLQATKDAAVFFDRFGALDGLNIAVIGDNAHGRVNRADAKMFSAFNDNTIIFVGPEGVRVDEDIKTLLEERKTHYEEVNSINEALQWQPDIFIFTRLQLERFQNSINPSTGKAWDIGSLEEVFYETCRLTDDVIKRSKPEAIFAHPQPSGDEFAGEFYDHPQAVTRIQSKMGVWAGAAVLQWLLKSERFKDEPAA